MSASTIAIDKVLPIAISLAVGLAAMILVRSNGEMAAQL